MSRLRIVNQHVKTINIKTVQSHWVNEKLTRRSSCYGQSTKTT